MIETQQDTVKHHLLWKVTMPLLDVPTPFKMANFNSWCLILFGTFLLSSSVAASFCDGSNGGHGKLPDDDEIS